MISESHGLRFLFFAYFTFHSHFVQVSKSRNAFQKICRNKKIIFFLYFFFTVNGCYLRTVCLISQKVIFTCSWWIMFILYEQKRLVLRGKTLCLDFSFYRTYIFFAFLLCNINGFNSKLGILNIGSVCSSTSFELKLCWE